MDHNQSIFIQLHAAGTERKVETLDGMAIVYSNLAVGEIQGEARTLQALVSRGTTAQDLWYVVNLMSNTNSQYLATVAVLGATSEEQAQAWALRQVGVYLGASYGFCALTNHIALKRLLDRPSSSTYQGRISQDDLNTMQAQITGKPVCWNGAELISHTSSSADLMRDLVKFDHQAELTTRMTATDLPTLLESMDAEVIEYDALIVDYGHLDMMMSRLSAAIGKAAVGDVSVINQTQTKPFKRNGVAQVAAIFEMNDGQAVTIVFHNPDSTPSKLSSTDILTSWKWLLNKRDISAAVQPEQGKDVQLPQLAVRIMKLVNQNSARFKRTQIKKTENEALLLDTQARVDGKKQQLVDLDVEILALQARADAKVAVPTLSVTEINTNAFQRVAAVLIEKYDWAYDEAGSQTLLKAFVINKNGEQQLATLEQDFAEIVARLNSQDAGLETLPTTTLDESAAEQVAVSMDAQVQVCATTMVESTLEPTINLLYQSVIDGAPITRELLVQLEQAAQQEDAPSKNNQLTAATHIAVQAMQDMLQRIVGEAA